MLKVITYQKNPNFKHKLKSNTMKRILFVMFIFLLHLMLDSCCRYCLDKTETLELVVNDALEFSRSQSSLMAASLQDRPGVLPKTADRFGNLETCDPAWWASGFFPGQLWYMYEYSGDTALRDLAREFTSRVAGLDLSRSDHDVGFQFCCSFGNGYRLLGDTAYLRIIQEAARVLSARFDPQIGCIRSWNPAPWNRQWQYPVIIDNMMNLELLLWSAGQFNEPRYREIAIQHADTTLKNHYRPDHSCYHVVSYDTVTGLPELKHTSQGYNHESTWARGQAWGLYGYVMMYRYTREPQYLAQAKAIADFLIHHPHLPKDKIPYWDFNAPNIPDTYRDASAGAIICSALIELSRYTEKKEAAKYLTVAETQLRTLHTAYENAPGNNGNFILKHSVGHMPNNTEVDAPLSYTDYYYVEALMRMKELKGF